MKRELVTLTNEVKKDTIQELNMNEMFAIRGGGSTPTIDPGDWE